MQRPQENTTSARTLGMAVLFAGIACASFLLAIDYVKNGGLGHGREVVKVVSLEDADDGFFYFTDANRLGVKRVTSPYLVPAQKRQLVILAEPGMRTPLEQDEVYVVDVTQTIGAGKFRAHLMEIEKVIVMASVEAQIHKENGIRVREARRRGMPQAMPAAADIPKLAPGQLAPAMPNSMPEGAPPLPTAEVGQKLSGCDGLRGDQEAYTRCVNGALQ